MSSSKKVAHLADLLSRTLEDEVTVRSEPEGELSLSSVIRATPAKQQLVDEISSLLKERTADRARIQTLAAQLEESQRFNQELLERNDKLMNMVIHDLLTGLYTRWFVQEKIEEEIERATRFSQPASVLMVDLDHFKAVNDTYGHLIGDEVLRELGKVIRNSLRIYDVPGRYGGEEFCLMLPGTDGERTMVVAERIRSNIESHRFELDDTSFNVTASIGVAALSTTDMIDSADRLIGLADEALYNAKESGRNRIERWETPN